MLSIFYPLKLYCKKQRLTTFHCALCSYIHPYVHTKPMVLTAKKLQFVHSVLFLNDEVSLLLTSDAKQTLKAKHLFCQIFK